MRTLGKTIKASAIHRGKWKQELAIMLRNYRATLHATTGATPAELLFGRKLRIKLPEQPSKPDTASHDAIRIRDTARKQQIKS